MVHKMPNLANNVKLSHSAHHSNRPKVQNPNFIIFEPSAVRMKGYQVFTFGHHVQNPGQIDKTDVNLGRLAQKGHVRHENIRLKVLHVFLPSQLGLRVPGVTW